MFWMFPSSNIPQSIDQIIIKLCRGFITILIIWISYAGRGEKSKTCRPGGPWGLELMSDLWHKKSPPWAHGQVALLIVFFFFSWAVLNQSLHVTLDYNSIKSIPDEITFSLLYQYDDITFRGNTSRRFHHWVSSTVLRLFSACVCQVIFKRIARENDGKLEGHCAALLV